MSKRAELEAAIAALENAAVWFDVARFSLFGADHHQGIEAAAAKCRQEAGEYRAQLAALPEPEEETGTHKLFVWTDHCTFAAVAHAKTVAQARELIEGEDLGGHDGSCPERVAARKLIYGDTPGIYRGPQAVLMFDTGKSEEPEQPWTDRERRLVKVLREAQDDIHSEYCGRHDHHSNCKRIETALAEAPRPDPRAAGAGGGVGTKGRGVMDLAKVDLMCEIDSLKRGWAACEAERDRLRAERDAAQAEAAGLREALERLTNKLREVHADDKYKAVWLLHQLHNGSYSGPSYGREFQDGLDALARTSAQHRDRIEAAVLQHAANLIRQTTPDGDMKTEYYSGMTEGRMKACSQIEEMAAERLERGE